MKKYVVPAIEVYRLYLTEDVCQIIKPSGPDVPAGSRKMDFTADEEKKEWNSFWSTPYWEE